MEEDLGNNQQIKLLSLFTIKHPKIENKKLILLHFIMHASELEINIFDKEGINDYCENKCGVIKKLIKLNNKQVLGLTIFGKIFLGTFSVLKKKRKNYTIDLFSEEIVNFDFNAENFLVSKNKVLVDDGLCLRFYNILK